MWFNGGGGGVCCLTGGIYVWFNGGGGFMCGLTVVGICVVYLGGICVV